MTWNAARLVYDDERRIFEEHLDLRFAVRHDRRERRRRFNFDAGTGVHDGALDGAPSIEQHGASRHHFASIAPRRRMTRAHQIVVEPLAGRITQ